jgi:hypothetical protein
VWLTTYALSECPQNYRVFREIECLNDPRQYHIGPGHDVLIVIYGVRGEDRAVRDTRRMTSAHSPFRLATGICVRRIGLCARRGYGDHRHPVATVCKENAR